MYFEKIKRCGYMLISFSLIMISTGCESFAKGLVGSFTGFFP
jgi:hypothetical protein